MTIEVHTTLAPECPFCERLSKSATLWADDDFLVLLPVGCIAVGYLLLVPRLHVHSFANLSLAKLCGAFDVAEEVREIIRQVFHLEGIVIAEHGTGVDAEKTASSCYHAHWHIIPVDTSFLMRACQETAGPPRILKNRTQLLDFRGRSYIFVSPLKGKNLIWPYSEVFCSQFIRKICAEYHGIGKFYNWREFELSENMQQTRELLSEPIQQKLYRGCITNCA